MHKPARSVTSAQKFLRQTSLFPKRPVGPCSHKAATCRPTTSRCFLSSIPRQFHTSTAKMVPPIAQNRTLLSNHPDKVRMLVLETDETHPDTQKETGSFGVVLGELLKKDGDEHKPSLGIETAMQYVVEPEGGAIPKLEEIGDDVHAILITGSCWDAHGDDPWILKLIEFIKGVYLHVWLEGTQQWLMANGMTSGHIAPTSVSQGYVSDTKFFAELLVLPSNHRRTVNGSCPISPSSSPTLAAIFSTFPKQRPRSTFTRCILITSLILLPPRPPI